jgi:hypothetical protein
VKVEALNDDPEPVEVLKETWIKFAGLQAKWCEWNSLDQVVSVCGLLVDVDWQSLFKNNAQEIRVKVKCRRLMSTHASILVDSIGPPSAEVCRTTSSFR